MADDTQLDTAVVLRRLRERADELAATDGILADRPRDIAATAPSEPLTEARIAQLDAAQVQAATFAAAARLQGTLIRTYRHLRLVLVAVAPAILIAIAAVWNSGYASLPSISHYYYTPARMIFAGALVTASAALLALSGRGSQRGWLDLAALFAPLIALVPTKIENGQVPGLEAVCPGGQECLPEDVEVYVSTGILIWFVFSVLVLAYGIVSALIAQAGGDDATPQEPRSLHGTWTPIVTGIAIVAAAGGLWIWGNDVFLAHAHFVSASLFFVIITIVALNRARRIRGALLATLPGWIALLMAADLIAAVVVLLWSIDGPVVLFGIRFGAVFVVEAVALVLFTAFWLHETRRTWNEADPD